MKRFAILCIANLMVAIFGWHIAKAQRPLKSKPANADNYRIVADPETRITYDGDVPHMEAYIAASSSNPDFLFACGELMIPGRKLNATETRLYVSYDSGAIWNTILLPNEVDGGWDNAVVAGTDGVVYFLTSNLQKGLTVYHSFDEGKTWEYAIISDTKNWDRPHIVVDHSSGPNRGRLYVAGETDNGVCVVSSSDGGKTFSPPVIACGPKTGFNVATTASPLILSDGTLLVPCAPYPEFSARGNWNKAELGLVSSVDGGLHFTPYLEAFSINRQLPQDYFSARLDGRILLSGNFMQGPSFAAAPKGSPFADNLYALWQDVEAGGSPRLLFARSTDRGLTWSAPRWIDSGRFRRGDISNQGVPMLSVNQDGVIGIAWFDGRNNLIGKGYDVYFTASVDGGQSFLPSVRLSSSSSRPGVRSQNTVPAFVVSRPTSNGERMVSMNSAFSTRSTGADYSTMAVDAAGRFHPLWTDARDSMAWQLYTSTVRVLRQQRLQALKIKYSKLAIDASSVNCVFDERIKLMVGEPRWNDSGSEMIVPVQLFNASPDTLINPITVRVSDAALSGASARRYISKAPVPTFFDPVKTIFSDVAEYEYPISDNSPLFPNGVSAVLNWRLHITAPEWMEFKFKTIVTSSGCLIKR